MSLTRRDLFLSAAAAAAAAGCAEKGPAAKRAEITRAVLISMLPKDLSYEERFRMAVELGFSEMEAQTVDSDEEAGKIKDAADKAGLRIHSVMNMAHWGNPFSSADPAVVEAGLAGAEASIAQAALWGADTVLLVPAVVSDETTYAQAWERSQLVIRKLLPSAEKHKVTLAIEEVWNRFLLTSADFNRYIDEFNHPLVKAYFDIGNIVHYGVPQHWIREVGNRIVKLHLKDYSRKEGFVALGEGEVEWDKVRQALDDIGYQGAATVELRGGDREYLRDVGERVDRLLSLT